MRRHDVVNEARKWIGAPWVHQGRGPKAVDCIGLVVVVGRAFDVGHEDRTDYPRVPLDNAFRNHLRKYLTRVSFSDNRVGTIAVFRQSIFPCHVGIFSEIAGIPHVIHAHARIGEVVEHPFVDGEYDLNLVEVLKFPSLED